MKKNKKTYKFCVFLLVLILILNGSTFIGYANENEAGTTEEKSSYTIGSQVQIENTIVESNTSFALAQESYPSSFYEVNLSNGVYYIKNIGTGKYIDIHGPYTDKIHQWNNIIIRRFLL